ncbi:10995_t:CDS:2 [Ambispora leptoticha]|uniref:Mitochondrial import inner membrane translocase subunit TIM50 n=1 Tax=Ambispora leptoticha TaxID=144679 RepID=A0A9N8VDJ1_9GLOM|nr:10995_t:CDS:2 [Ambispora leptoticha]
MEPKTLILDLDETLIHSALGGSRAAAQMIEVMVDKHACLYYVHKRPHVDRFLKKVSEWYKVVIFTASMSEYADPVIDWLDPNKNLISSRYFREVSTISFNKISLIYDPPFIIEAKSCTNRSGVYMKDLTKVEPDLSKVCLIDNSPISYALQQENGIPIKEWTNDPKDEALLDLLPFLDALRFTEDVRSVLSLRIF